MSLLTNEYRLILNQCSRLSKRQIGIKNSIIQASHDSENVETNIETPKKTEIESHKIERRSVERRERGRRDQGSAEFRFSDYTLRLSTRAHNPRLNCPSLLKGTPGRPRRTNLTWQL